MSKAMQRRVVMTAQSQKIVDDLHGRVAELEAENARLSEALAEAEKKGNASAARFTRLHTIASKIRWNDLGLPALNNASTQEGLMELSQFLLQDALEECLDRQGLPPRDLSQGGQHG